MSLSPKRVGLIAGREFQAAVMNKGFVIGLLVMPLMVAIVAVVFPRVISNRAQGVRGEVAIIDPTGQVAPALHEALSTESIKRRRVESATRALENAPAVVRDAASSQAAMDRAIGVPP